MNLVEIAATLVTGPVLVDENGQPDGDEFIEGMGRLIAKAYGLHGGFVGPILAQVVRQSRADTYTRLVEPGVLVCTATGCNRDSAFFSKDRAVCHVHVGWEPAPARCTCGVAGWQSGTRGNHHGPDCPMWLHGALTQDALDEWADGHV